MSETYRAESRKEWRNPEGAPCRDGLKLGCLQRIADATEVMAKNFTALQAEAKWEKEHRQSAEARAERLERVIRALRGVITKAKRKARGVA